MEHRAFPTVPDRSYPWKLAAVLLAILAAYWWWAAVHPQPRVEYVVPGFIAGVPPCPSQAEAVAAEARLRSMSGQAPFWYQELVKDCKVAS
jgi:hypothetical protein